MKLETTKYSKEQREQLFSELKPLILLNDELLTYFKIAEATKYGKTIANDITENKFTYDIYLFWNFVFDSNNEKYYYPRIEINKNIQDLLNNELLNYTYYLYENMEYYENNSLLKTIAKSFYLANKFKSNTHFSNEIYKYFFNIRDIEKEKENIDFSEKAEQDPEKYFKKIQYLQTRFMKTVLEKSFFNYINHETMNKEIWTSKEIRQELKKIYLEETSILNTYLDLKKYEESLGNNLNNESIINSICNIFKENVRSSKNFEELAHQITSQIENLRDKYNIDTIISSEEENIIENKVKETLKEIENYNYKYIESRGIDLVIDLLSFDKNINDKLKDNISDLTLKNLEQKKEKKELKKDSIPISELRDHSLKNKNSLERDYIMMSSTKQGNDLINGITSYASYNESIYSIQKRINDLESKKNKKADEKDQLNFLKEKLENGINTKEELEQEEKELLKNKNSIIEKLEEIDNVVDKKYLMDLRNQIDKRLKNIQGQKSNKMLFVQQNLFNNDVEYTGKYITTSISIDDFDLSKFTDEGITIFLYMIDQIITNPDITTLTFDIDFIFNKMNNYKHNKKSVVRNEIKNLTDILYNMNIRIIKEDKLNDLEIGRELRVITGRQWTKEKKAIKDSNGLKSMTITLNDDFKAMILNSKIAKTRLGEKKEVKNLQYFKIPLDLIKFKNKKARALGLYILQQCKLNRNKIEKGEPLRRTMKELYFNDYLKLKYNKKQGQFKKDIVYKLKSYLNSLEDHHIILYNTDAFDKLIYDLSNQPIEQQKKVFDNEIIEIKLIPQITNEYND